MSDKSNAYALVIADLKRRRAEIDIMIGNLEALAGTGGEPSSPANADVALPEREGAKIESPAGTNPYLGMSIPQATIAVLREQRETLRAGDIVKALEAGGLILTGKNNANTVNSVLRRRQAQVGDVVSPKRGHWGLKEWYPGESSCGSANHPEAVLRRGMSKSPLPTPPSLSSLLSRVGSFLCGQTASPVDATDLTALATPLNSGGVFLFGGRVVHFACRHVHDELGELVGVAGALGSTHASNMARLASACHRGEALISN